MTDSTNAKIPTEFRVSDSQLQKVLDVVTPNREPGFPFDKLLQFLQVVSIVGAAVWTLYNYLTFEREEHIISRQIQQLNRDQQEFTLQQNRILADTQQTLANVNLQQQQFSLNQQKLLASTTEQKARLDLATVELENRLKGNELKVQNETPFNYSVELTLNRLSGELDEQGFGEWEAVLAISVSNNNSTSSFNLNAGSIRQYLGTVRFEGGPSHIVRFNAPDEGYGPIKWVNVGTTNYCSIDRCRQLFDSELPDGFKMGGIAFGRFLGKEGNQYAARYHVRAKPHSMVGFITTFAVESERETRRWDVLTERSTDDQSPQVTTTDQADKK